MAGIENRMNARMILNTLAGHPRFNEIFPNGIDTQRILNLIVNASLNFRFPDADRVIEVVCDQLTSAVATLEAKKGETAYAREGLEIFQGLATLTNGRDELVIRESV